MLRRTGAEEEVGDSGASIAAAAGFVRLAGSGCG
jgi:hypothetical protein